MHARVVYLWWEKVSCLERCPQFKSVLIERERGSTVHTHSYLCSLLEEYGSHVYPVDGSVLRHLCSG